MTTRWSDDDMFGHLNNAAYVELFDTVFNAWMIRETAVRPASGGASGAGRVGAGVHRPGHAQARAGARRRVAAPRGDGRSTAGGVTLLDRASTGSSGPSGHGMRDPVHDHLTTPGLGQGTGALAFVAA